MSEKTPKHKRVKTKDLIPYINNARTHSEQQVAQIAASIREFGFLNPIITDGDGGILAGHGRLEAARLLGMDTVPVVEAKHLTEAQRKAYIIADNKLALNAGWDELALARELRGLAEMEFDLSLTGFDEKELSALLDGLGEEKEGLTDPDAVPDVPESPASRPGDIWIMGQHRLMCGDSTDVDQVAALMDGALADLVWTDPPYNVAISGKAGTILNDDMDSDNFRSFLRDAYDAYYTHMRPGAVIYVAHADTERVAFTEAMVSAGLKLSQVLVWVKQSAPLTRQDFNWKHEPILYGWKEGRAHYFCEDFTLTTVIDDDVDLKKLTKAELLAIAQQLRDQIPTSVIRHDRPTKSELRPTMKPVALVERMITWSSLRGDTVMDLFGGSGSTLIAAHKAARRARLMELDPKYCDVIVRRWQEYAGDEATLQGDNRTFSDVATERA